MKTFLLLGSNLGERKINLANAINLIEENIAPVINRSSIYITKAWGKTDQPDFYNQAIQIETDLEPLALLKEIKAIEKELGRVSNEKWGARIIDIDILFYGTQVFESDSLTIPHPFLHERMFTLKPLEEIAPDFVHPKLNKRIAELIAECKDSLEVSVLNE